MIFSITRQFSFIKGLSATSPLVFIYFWLTFWMSNNKGWIFQTFLNFRLIWKMLTPPLGSISKHFWIWEQSWILSWAWQYLTKLKRKYWPRNKTKFMFDRAIFYCPQFSKSLIYECKSLNFIHFCWIYLSPHRFPDAATRRVDFSQSNVVISKDANPRLRTLSPP